LSQVAYVASADGTIQIIDGAGQEVVQTLRTEPGLLAFRFDPSGRWGFAANGRLDRVEVVDASAGAIVRSVEVGSRPHQFAFTDTYAYVRHLGTAEVTLIPLNGLGVQGALATKNVPVGTSAPGDYAYPAAADAIAPTGEWTAVVASNPGDLTVYYYMEGMIAPMGSYSTYGRIPRAVGVVDRSVRETEKGVYSAKIRVPAEGDYNVAFLIDSPTVYHCFDFSAEPDPLKVAENERQPVQLQYLNEDWNIPVGKPFPLRFALRRSGSEEPIDGLQDVVVLATRPPGNWQHREPAKPLGEGRYEVSLMADQPGVYYVSVGIPSLGLDFTKLPYISLRAAKEDLVERESMR
jgi:hypothetical protein